MSATFALIRFKTTGNIYYGCYEGASDIIIPFLCTPEECYNKDEDRYNAISYCRHLNATIKSWKFPDYVSDLDDIEIYSDYGGGLYWPSKGSESIKMIKENLAPWDDCYENMHHGIPDWVKKYEELNEI